MFECGVRNQKKYSVVSLLNPAPRAGGYGAVHNHISYTVSPDYFHAFKFHQFGIPPELRGRVGASIVGWHASWWMGLFVGIPVPVIVAPMGI